MKLYSLNHWIFYPIFNISMIQMWWFLVFFFELIFHIMRMWSIAEVVDAFSPFGIFGTTRFTLPNRIISHERVSWPVQKTAVVPFPLVHSHFRSQIHLPHFHTFFCTFLHSLAFACISPMFMSSLRVAVKMKDALVFHSIFSSIFCPWYYLLFLIRENETFKQFYDEILF